ncbi:MAG: aminopeptidase P family protein [Rubellimicrobium sp.]|nr:aminopeptidase P family protein [Rubellimicrobium sp.]
MFQTFEVSARPEQGPPRLAALRGAMKAAGLDGWITPRADIHQGEYVAERDALLQWLTGFTGSAGFCAATADRAAVFVDGRYRLQVREQVADVFAPVDWPATQLPGWLRAALPEGGRVGFDPWLHTLAEVAAWEKALAGSGIEMVAHDNLVAPLWEDRPPPPDAPFTVWPIEVAGEDHAAKRARLGKGIAAAGAGVAVLTGPDSIAWLLNIRGSDVRCNPVPHALAFLHSDGSVDLFAGPGKADPLRAHLGDAVRLHDRDGFETALAALSGPVLVDPQRAPVAVAQVLGAAGIALVEGDDPCILPKARKNPAELRGMRAAHLRDGAAMVNFLAWVTRAAPEGGLTEISVVEKLEGFRRATNKLIDVSFDTIAGTGPHGAINHYRVTEATNLPVQQGELLLVDSGGQYVDGTTDITRTIPVGKPPAGAAGAFTRVLKGMVALSRVRFPHGVTGGQLDALARYHLWLAGQDFDHGTGHGVGAGLSVHEGPQRISRISNVPLEPGMIVSNEPGYYREGAFGIRIENLLVVEEKAPPEGGDPDRRWLGFETITFVPIERRLIVADMLDEGERAWVDAYHAEVLARIGPRVEGEALDWLKAACAPL